MIYSRAREWHGPTKVLVPKQKVKSKTRRRCRVCGKLRRRWTDGCPKGRFPWGRLPDGRRACWLCLTRMAEAGTLDDKVWRPIHDHLALIKDVLES